MTGLRSRSLAILAAAVAAAVVFWQTRPAPVTEDAPSRVTSAEALALAQRYVEHEWTAGPRNVYHGPDPSGIRVDTGDAGFRTDEAQGWWRTDAPNRGIPYKWGGFDLPEEFDAGLRAGKWAGDVYTREKRRALDDAVTPYAVGIDCSGFVSRCWQLPRSYSTRELPQLCTPVENMADLRPGDIFNRHNSHVRLFAGWADAARTRVVTYEASERVQRSEYALSDIVADGYSAWRYKGMRD